MTVTPEHILDAIPWESEAQKKGFLNLRQYLRGFSPETTNLDWKLALVAAYFIQKDHESQEWWSGVMGERLGALQMDVKTLGDHTAAQIQELRTELQAEIARLRKSIDCPSTPRRHD